MDRVARMRCRAPTGFNDPPEIVMYEQQYTFLDDAWHAIGEDEQTVCGLVIPHGNGWVTAAVSPAVKSPHCGPDVEEPAAKAKTGGKVA